MKLHIYKIGNKRYYSLGGIVAPTTSLLLAALSVKD